MSYGAPILENFHRAATFVDKILKGANPTDLPFEQPTRYVLAMNMTTARASASLSRSRFCRGRPRGSVMGRQRDPNDSFQQPALRAAAEACVGQTWWCRPQ
jgi:hypothetical protein